MSQTTGSDFTLEVSSSSSMTANRVYPLHIVRNMDLLQLILDFSAMSDHHFSAFLAMHSLNTSQGNFPYTYLLEEPNMLFTRQLFHLINKLNYFRLQHEQWSHYFNLGVNEGIWQGYISSKVAHWNSIPATYGRSKRVVEQRLAQLGEQLQDMTNQLQQLYQRSPVNIDMHQLTTIVADIIHKDQYQLCIELERRRHVLVLDAKDHHLLSVFHRLKPRNYETHSAQLIWKATDDEQKLWYELAIFKHWLSQTRSASLHCTLRDLALPNINSTVASLVFDAQPSLATTTTESCGNATPTIDSLAQSVAKQTILTMELLAHDYQQKILNEKEKVLKHLETSRNQASVHAILDAINNRQINMIERAKYNIEQRPKAYSHYQAWTV